MRNLCKEKIIELCKYSISKYGIDAQISLYQIIAINHEQPEHVMAANIWWNNTHKLDDVEKAVKIKEIVESEL